MAEPHRFQASFPCGNRTSALQAASRFRRSAAGLLRLSAALWLFGSGVTACGVSDQSSELTAVTPAPTDPLEACRPGLQRACTLVDLGMNGPQQNCFAGVQHCSEGGTWGQCVSDDLTGADRGTTAKSAPTAAVAKAAPVGPCTDLAPCSCTDDPCNPTCQAILDGPFIPVSGGGGNTTQDWPSVAPTDLPSNDTTQTCFSGAQCGNAPCQTVATSPSCGTSFNKCLANATPPTANCDPCVTEICRFKPACCNATPCGPNGRYNPSTGSCMMDLAQAGYNFGSQSSWIGARGACQAVGPGWDLAFGNDAAEVAYMASQNPTQTKYILGTYLYPPPATPTGNTCIQMASNGGAINASAPCNQNDSYALCEGPHAPRATDRCTHEICTTGTALDPLCNDCTQKICQTAGLEHCCNASTGPGWDAACVAAVASCGQACGCPAGTTELGGRCYIKVSLGGNQSWTTARSACTPYGDLASLNTAAEVQLLRANGTMFTNQPWIGVYRTTAAGSNPAKFSWVDGTPWAAIAGELSGNGLGTSDTWNSAAYVNSTNTPTVLQGEQNPNHAYALCEGGKTGGSSTATRQWSQECVDLIPRLCAAQCGASQPSKVVDSYCDGWDPGEVTTTGCAQADLALAPACVDASNVPVVPVCNHGTADFTTNGNSLTYFAGKSAPQSTDCASSLTGGASCAIPNGTVIASGKCVAVPCPGLPANAAVRVNVDKTLECTCFDDWAQTPSTIPACATTTSCFADVNGGAAPTGHAFLLFDTAMGGSYSTNSATNTTPYAGIFRTLLNTLATPTAGLNLSLELAPSNYDEGLGFTHDGCIATATNCPDRVAYCGDPSIAARAATDTVYWGTHTPGAAAAPTSGMVKTLDSKAPNLATKNTSDQSLDVAVYGALVNLRTRVLANPKEKQTLVLFTNGSNFTNSKCATGVGYLAYGGQAAVEKFVQDFYTAYGILTYVVAPSGISATALTAAQTVATKGGTTLIQVGATQNAGGTTAVATKLAATGRSLAIEQTYALGNAANADESGTTVTLVASSGAQTALTRVSASLGNACGGETKGYRFDNDAAPGHVILCDLTFQWLQANPGNKVAINVPCSGGSTPQPLDEVRVYAPTCGVGTKIQWDYLGYAATMPGGSTGTISIRSGIKHNGSTIWNTTNSQVVATLKNGASPATAVGADVNCSFGRPCAVNLYDELSSADALRSTILEVRVKLTPSGTDAPSVNDLRVNYSCIDAE